MMDETECRRDEESSGRQQQQELPTFVVSSVYHVGSQQDGHPPCHTGLEQSSAPEGRLSDAPVEPGRLRHNSDPAVVAQAIKTVLVVEAEYSVRAITARILRGQGYAVLEAANGPEALRLCRQHQGDIHLLITDVVMPRDDGQLLAAQLRALRPEIAVLYVSGYIDEGMVREEELAGITDSLLKPVTPSALAQKVRQVLERQAASPG